MFALATHSQLLCCRTFSQATIIVHQSTSPLVGTRRPLTRGAERGHTGEPTWRTGRGKGEVSCSRRGEGQTSRGREWQTTGTGHWRWNARHTSRSTRHTREMGHWRHSASSWRSRGRDTAGCAWSTKGSGRGHRCATHAWERRWHAARERREGGNAGARRREDTETRRNSAGLVLREHGVGVGLAFGGVRGGDGVDDGLRLLVTDFWKTQAR